MTETQRKRAVSRDGTEIYYETYLQDGQKPQLLFVHGVGGDLDAWQFILRPVLAAGYGSMALDLRGSGYSGHPRGLKSYAMERMTEDILSVIEAEELEKVTVIGHSGGAVCSLAFALAHPDKINKLILLSPSYAPPRYGRSKALRALYAPFITALALISPKARKPWHSPYPRGKHHQEVEVYGLARTIYKNSLASYLLISKTLIHIDFEGALPEVNLPTLLVAGEKDGIYPASVAGVMREKMPDATLKVIPGANHVLPLNNPKEVAEAILQFLRG